MSDPADSAPPDPRQRPDETAVAADELVDDGQPPAGAAETEGADAEIADAPDDDPAAALAAAREEAGDWREKALRAQAEVENVRRRASRETENAHKFALEKFATQLLPVGDSLEKSVEAVREHEGGDEAVRAIKEGIELSERMFRDTLEKFGIERVDPLGAPFDPERHEAVSMIEAPSAEPNSVVDVLQTGYTLNGRLLRAAMVIVAKAPAGS